MGVLDNARINIKFLCIGLMLLSFAQCELSLYRVVFVYTGKVNDFGFSYIHELGKVEALMNLDRSADVLNARIESKSYGDVHSYEKFFGIVSNESTLGVDVFITMDAVLQPLFCNITADFPDITFISENKCRDGLAHPNYEYYDTKYYEGRYLSGYICASKVAGTSRKVGFLTPKGIGPIVVSQANGFYAGAQAYAVEKGVDIDVHLVETDNFFTPAVSIEAANTLIEAGVQCVAGNEDSNKFHQVFIEKGYWSTGYLYEGRYLYGSNVLYSAVFDIGSIFTKLIENFIAGTTAHGYFGVVPSGLSETINPQERFEVYQVMQQVQDGTRKVFCDPLIQHDFAFSHFVPTDFDGDGCLLPQAISKMTKYSDSITYEAHIEEQNILVINYLSVYGVTGPIMMTLNFLSILITSFFMIDIIRHLNVEIYRAASTTFCITICVNLLIGMSNMYMSFREETPLHFTPASS